ncbi:UDP-N-acetylmuramate dehydrogenase, Cytokinin dehydrogenase [Zostera marina]|uniref:cytokinin dehydrogenase n=1 Tax=Zostera marina TaxID=29655 RepID=A0A0K9P0S7_ZOSMR|nr:UDP-N-acetylmuramate dehydrogenase, Cytokinin dehydrogenase [Zostera marina]
MDLLLIVFLFGFLFPFGSESAFVPPPEVCPSCFHTPTVNQSIDFGMLIQRWPASLFQPKQTRDISHLLRFVNTNLKHGEKITVGPNGARRSSHGQAQVPGGIVVDMMSLQSTQFKINPSKRYIDVNAGALWVDVLKETLKHGLTPRSWTDYLYLTVGGTLSVGGISGQSFRYGPQIMNVLQLDVITGKGDMMTCSDKHNSELFHGVLGGLGQFGIITRARIILEVAPKKTKWVKIQYDDFKIFTKDQELLIAMAEPDYVEGYLTGGAQISYTIEFALYYNEDDPIQKMLDVVMSRLSSTKIDTSDVTYFDFLNRVGREELDLRKQGLWDVPHPWLNLLVPKSQIYNFNHLILQMVAKSPVTGALLIYPVYTNKWNNKMSMMLPKGNNTVVYVVSILRSVGKNCTIGSSCLKNVLGLNQDIIDKSVEGKGSMGVKEYLAYSTGKDSTWIAHFGTKWKKFKSIKHKYDPLHILSPGPGIFNSF